MLNREKIWHEQLTDLSTSPVRWCRHFTLGNPKKSFFNIIIHILQIIYVTSQENKLQLLYRSFICLLTVVYLHSPSNACGARYRRSAVMLRPAAAACCGLNFSAAWCTMRMTSVEKDSKHVLMQKVVTLNTCCDTACLTFQLSHITTGSFHSHRWQLTTGSL